MYRSISKLILYKEGSSDGLLLRFAEVWRRWEELASKDNTSISREEVRREKDSIISQVYTIIHQLLDLATEYGFNHNLWHDYLSYVIITNENPFSLICEKEGSKEGSVNEFALHDFKIFQELYQFDFQPIEEDLGINVFHIISNYEAMNKKSSRYNQNVSQKVQYLSKALNTAKDAIEFFQIVTDFYKAYGVGSFGLNKAFRLNKNQNDLEFVPITNTQEIYLSDLVGYDIQKKKLLDNTRAFVEGKAANNVLLFGDSGTGKSSSVKAILNEYYPQGLRMVELFKHQFGDLSEVIARIKNRNYKFIIYMDDLSFEEFEIEYKYLKAVIEGGLETKPDNVLIYATSNRRHLIKETWNDRSDIETKEGLHRSDTMQEKLSLVSRFGVTINFSAPQKKEFIEIVKTLAKRQGITHIDEEQLVAMANMWELSHGGMSGRTAQQFIHHLASQTY